MEVTVQVPDYSSDAGFRFEWDYAFTLEVSVEHDHVVLRANTAGLNSLARHLLERAPPSVRVAYHFHLDSDASLEEHSMPLLVEKIDD